MIEVKGPDGAVIRFPEGTSDADINRAMAQVYGGGASAPASALAPERSTWDAVVDNVVGRDDGVMSPGEKLATLLNMGGESMTMTLAGDEADAALRAIGPGIIPGGRGFGEAYDSRLEFNRANEAQVREENPILSFGADLGGAIVPGLAWAGAAGRGATRLTQIGIGGLLGVAGGATSGFMEGEGGFANRVNNMLPQGLSPTQWGPTLTGGLLGAAIPGVGAAAGAAYRAYGPGAARQLRQAQRAFGLDRTGAEFVADAVERDAPFAGQNLAEAGPNALNAQMGPETMALADFAVNRPGGAASRSVANVENFTTARAQDFRSTVDDVLGDRVGVTARQTRLMQDTQAGRNTTYDAAYARSIDWTQPRAQELVGMLRALPARAYASIEEVLATDNALSRGGVRGPLIRRMDGIPTLGRMPTVKELDLITRSIYDLKDPFAGAGPTARNRYVGMANEIRDTLDELVPEYAAARAAGGDAIANREAIEFGAMLLNGKQVPLDEANAAIARMGPAERTFAAQGVRDHIGEVMGNVQRLRRQGGNREELQQAIAPVAQMLTEDGQAKLIALLGPKEAERLLQSAREVHSAVVLRNGVVRGSGTQPRQVQEARLDAAIPVSPSEALQRGYGVSGAAAAAARPLAGDPATARMAAKDEVLDAIASALFSPAGGDGPGTALSTLMQLPGLLSTVNRTAARVNAGANELGGLLGYTATQRTAEPRRRPLELTVTRP